MTENVLSFLTVSFSGGQVVSLGSSAHVPGHESS